MRSIGMVLVTLCAVLATHAAAEPARREIDPSVFGIVMGEPLPALRPCLPDTALPQPSDANCLKQELAQAPQDPPSPKYEQHFVGVSPEVFDTDALAPNPLEGMQVLVNRQTKAIENVVLIAELRDRAALMRTLTKKYGPPSGTERASWLREGERVRMPMTVWRFPKLVVRFLGDVRQRLGVLEVSTADYEAQRAQEAIATYEDSAPSETPEPRKPRRSL